MFDIVLFPRIQRERPPCGTTVTDAAIYAEVKKAAIDLKDSDLKRRKNIFVKQTLKTLLLKEKRSKEAKVVCLYLKVIIAQSNNNE